MANELSWRTYKDGDRWIVGAREWQGSAISLTYGIFEAYRRRDLPGLLNAAASLSPAEAEAQKQHYDTYDRFETACDEGRFGAEWGNY